MTPGRPRTTRGRGPDTRGGLSISIPINWAFQEIRQNNVLARAESVREIYFIWQDIYRFSYEHDVQVLLKRSIEEPSEHLLAAVEPHLQRHLVELETVLGKASGDQHAAGEGVEGVGPHHAA